MTLQNPFKKRTVAIRRRQASGRPFSAPTGVARSASGASRPVETVYQSDLKLGQRWVTLSLTSAASVSPVIFDFIGASSRSLTSITVGGTFGTATESVLRQLMGSTPFRIGKVTFKVSVATIFDTMNAQFIQKSINGESKTVPINVSALQDPKNYSDKILIVDNLDLIADGGLAFQCTLANTEVLTLTFAVPDIANNYNMSR